MLIMNVHTFHSYYMYIETNHELHILMILSSH